MILNIKTTMEFIHLFKPSLWQIFSLTRQVLYESQIMKQFRFMKWKILSVLLAYLCVFGLKQFVNLSVSNNAQLWTTLRNKIFVKEMMFESFIS